MWELFTGEALFGKPATHYGELTLISKVIIACLAVLGIAALVMTAISLISHIMTGAPFIATSKRLTRKIVALADIRPGERVYDIGCGDGRFLIEANKFYGARAVGIDISPLVCALAKLTTWLKRADVVILCANFKTCDFQDADVIFCYLVPDQMAILGEKLKQLKKGAGYCRAGLKSPDGSRCSRCRSRAGLVLNRSSSTKFDHSF
ncbi:MAG: class I SAM-dependent methyltransferase [Desulfobacterales bacterium]|nr:class I SAM-dependent methyltransferase [Desulfobacterales bacterium]